MVVIMILDRSNRRRRISTDLFINKIFVRPVIINLVDSKSYDDYMSAFIYVKRTYIIKQSLKCADNTYVDISTGLVKDILSNRLKSVGQGLFANLNLKKGCVIDYFIGILRSTVEYADRVLNGFGGYGIHVNKDCVLDCYGSVKCKCSMANSPLGVSIDTSLTVVAANASLHIDVNRCGCVKLVADMDINFRSEIYYDYAHSYVFPAFD